MPIKRMDGRTSNYKGRSRQERPGTSRFMRMSEPSTQDTSTKEVEWTAEPPQKKWRPSSAQQSARAARELLDEKAAARAAAAGTPSD